MKGDYQTIDSDVLIIGSGIAGLEAALAVHKTGQKPLLVSKSPIGKANNTTLAGGAFACATDGFGVDAHIQKTLDSGCMLNDRRLVRWFVRRTPDKGESPELHKNGAEPMFLARYQKKAQILHNGIFDEIIFTRELSA